MDSPYSLHDCYWLKTAYCFQIHLMQLHLLIIHTLLSLRGIHCMDVPRIQGIQTPIQPCLEIDTNAYLQCPDMLIFKNLCLTNDKLTNTLFYMILKYLNTLNCVVLLINNKLFWTVSRRYFFKDWMFRLTDWHGFLLEAKYHWTMHSSSLLSPQILPIARLIIKTIECCLFFFNY